MNRIIQLVALATVCCTAAFGATSESPPVESARESWYAARAQMAQQECYYASGKSAAMRSAASRSDKTALDRMSYEVNRCLDAFVAAHPLPDYLKP